MGRTSDNARFSLGRVLATPGALAALERAGQTVLCLLQRHQRGDWGETCPEDAQLNEEAVQDGGRIFSAYVLSTGVKVWVITEADRAATTALLPDEY